MARAPSHALVHRDLTDLEGPAVVGCPLEPLDGLVHRAHLPQPVPAYELLGLRERPVDDRARLAVEPNALALPARGEAARSDDDPRLDQPLVELLVLRHGLRRRWGRRLALLAFLRQYQHTHLCLLFSDLIRGLHGGSDPHPCGCGSETLIHTSNDGRPFRHGLVPAHRPRWLYPWRYRSTRRPTERGSPSGSLASKNRPSSKEMREKAFQDGRARTTEGAGAVEVAKHTASPSKALLSVAMR